MFPALRWIQARPGTSELDEAAGEYQLKRRDRLRFPATKSLQLHLEPEYKQDFGS